MGGRKSKKEKRRTLVLTFRQNLNKKNSKLNTFEMGDREPEKKKTNVSITFSKKYKYRSFTFEMGDRNLKKKPRNVSINVSLKIIKKIYIFRSLTFEMGGRKPKKIVKKR